jgi:glycosyltransferase involved in cell wall biosynthesis
MKIVHTEASRGWGGQEIRILSEARGLIQRGHDVHLLCPPDSRIFEEATNSGVPVTAERIGDKSLRGLIAVRSWINKRRQERGIDVINSHSSTDSWLVALALATLRKPMPLVRTRHISAPVPNNWTTRWLYQRATRRIVTTGESLRQTLIENNGCDADQVISVPTGIDLNRFRPPGGDERAAARARLGVAEETFVIGIVATLRSWKGHRYLLDALAMLTQRAFVRPYMLVIVGDGPQRAHLEAQVAHAGITSWVLFTGNRGDVTELLHGFDAFALPSYANEGVPQALLQAMACSVPVVTTSAGAIGEIARNGDTALIVPERDSDSLARALERLAGDPTLGQGLAISALEMVRRSHGIAKMLDSMQGVFEKATGLASTRQAEIARRII